MRRKVKSAKWESVITGIFFTLFGLVLLIMSIISINNRTFFKENAAQTTGVIARITTEHRKRLNRRIKTINRAYVEYTVDGVEYREEISYHSGMHMGHKITLYYNPENPSQVISDKSSGVGPIILSCTFLIYGIAMLIWNTIGPEKLKWLLKKKVRAEGIVTNVYPDKSISDNGSNPYRAECEVYDDITGEMRIYKSESITEDITYLLESPVNVYYDPDNRNRYHVDLKRAMKIYKKTHFMIDDKRG